MEFAASWLFWFSVLFSRGAIRFSRFSSPISPVLGHNVVMDEKREMLMKLLFGSDDGDPGQTSAPTVSPRQLQRWQKATQKAQRINETLDNSQKSANILREMMHKD
ncbi:hypothetical protein HMPREF0578_2272 [Mobiluncus mulieris 28-1]|nr:hypothetical protein HMPREF0578_2272 [Mobiluncus mulieris 28-1]SPX75936.1 Uncharacterised protein [Mobiluncus mulieris]